MPKKDVKVNNILPLLPSYYLHFNIYGDGTEWIDQGLPTPNYFYRYSNAKGTVEGLYGLGYVIDGMFNSKKSIAYLEDMIRRFIVTLPIKERLMYRPTESASQHGIVYKLNDLQALESLKGNGRIVPKLQQLTARHNSGRFWETKLWIELEIKRNGGEGNIVSFDTLLDIVWNAWKWKDYSTCRSFTRNVWNWYEARDWTYHILNYRKSTKTEEEIYMTRKERALTNSTARAELAKRKVSNAISGMFAHEYKTKTDKWNISKLAKELDMSRNTVTKYLKELEEKNK